MVIIGPIDHGEQNIVYQSENVQLKINDQILTSGTLYITESSLSWKPVGMAESISISWPEIGVQAITNNPTKCIFFMMDNAVCWPGMYDPGVRANGNRVEEGGANASGSDDEDEGHASDCEAELTEFWLIPDDLNTVDVMFQSMTQCQALHPDPCDSVSEDEGGFMGMEEDGDNEVGQENMRNLNLNEDDEQFADAEED